jgi:hypothetical protein
MMIVSAEISRQEFLNANVISIQLLYLLLTQCTVQTGQFYDTKS